MKPAGTSARRSSGKRGATVWTRLQPMLWVSAIVSGVFGLGVALWHSQKAIEVPPPVQEVSRVSLPPFPPSAPSLENKPISEPFFAVAEGMALPARIAHWGEFLRAKADAPKLLAGLGKAPAIADSAPLIPSKFDCTTFVETVSALSRSRNSEEFFRNLLAIRYREGSPTYEARNHFPEADWIPNNEKAGILRDVTASLGGAWQLEVRQERKTIDRARWLAEQLRRGGVTRALASEAERKWAAPVEVAVPYLSISAMEKALDRIPEGAILNFVRSARSGSPVLITHQGFIVREGGVTYLQHASTHGKIAKVPLREYLAERERDTRAKGWPILGVNLNLLNS